MYQNNFYWIGHVKQEMSANCFHVELSMCTWDATLLIDLYNTWEWKCDSLYCKINRHSNIGRERETIVLSLSLSLTHTHTNWTLAQTLPSGHYLSLFIFQISYTLVVHTQTHADTHRHTHRHIHTLRSCVSQKFLVLLESRKLKGINFGQPKVVSKTDGLHRNEIYPTS